MQTLVIVCAHCKAEFTSLSAAAHVQTHPRKGSVAERVAKRLRRKARRTA